MKLNYLVPLDHGKTPNFNQNASASVKNPSYDPGNKFTMAWQSGFTGIGFNPKLTGRDITSLQDFLDPKFKGKIGMFADNQDLPTLALLAVGKVPETSTPADWQLAVDWLKKALFPHLRVYYRRRLENKHKKAGNIADFITNWGGHYDHMIVIFFLYMKN